MNLLNAAVIGMVAFFVLLLAFWWAFEVRSDEDVAMDEVDVAWDGPERMVLTGLVENPRRTDAVLEGVRYQVLLGDRTLAEGNVTRNVALAPRGTAEVNWTADVPGFAQAWWAAQAEEGGRAGLRVEGELLLRRGGEAAERGFAWETPLGDPTDALEGLENCPGQVLCVAGSDAGWRGERAALVLELEAPDASPALVHGGRARWMWEGREVAAADVPRVLVDAGGREEVGVELRPAGEALAAWWRAEAGAQDGAQRAPCGPGELTLEVELQVETEGDGEREEGPYGTEVTTVRWQLSRPWLLGLC